MSISISEIFIFILMKEKTFEFLENSKNLKTTQFFAIKKKCLIWMFIKNSSTSDPRVISYPLLGSPLPVIGIMTLYLWFVNNSGRKFMQHRKPYNCTTAINLYNIGQVFLNLYIGVTVNSRFNLFYDKLWWFSRPNEN